MKTKPKNRKLTQAQKTRKPKSHKAYANELAHKRELAEQARIAELLAKPYMLSMEFDLEKAFKQVDLFFTLNGLSMGNFDHNIYVPEMVVIEAYNQHDLIIAMKMQQANCRDWIIGTDTHFYNYDTEEVLTVPQQFKLDDIAYNDIFIDEKHATAKVKREGGFVTRWKGLHAELEDVYKTEVPAGFTKIRTEMKMVGECYFHSYASYMEFLTMKDLAAQGQLLNFLRDINRKMQEDGVLDEQMQPIAQTNVEGIPMGAFDHLIAERAKTLNPKLFSRVA